MKKRGTSSVTDMLVALADAVRLRILRVLEAEELSVGEVTRVLVLPQSTISRHLKVLAEGGWVTRRTAGTATLYRLVMDDLSVAARAVWVTVRGEAGETSEIKEDAARLREVLRERKLDAQAYFGRVAGEWDEIRAQLFGGDFTARALLSLLPREWVVADLGCGTGNVTELLAGRVERLVAIDQSEPMLEAAKKRLAGVKAQVQFIPGTLEKLPLSPRSVDAAVCVLVLHHVENPIAALREIKRVLRDERGGGIALVVEMMEHNREMYRQQMGHVHMGFAPDLMISMMKEAGFAEARVDVLPVDTSAKGPGLFVATGRMGKS